MHKKQDFFINLAHHKIGARFNKRLDITPVFIFFPNTNSSVTRMQLTAMLANAIILVMQKQSEEKPWLI